MITIHKAHLVPRFGWQTIKTHPGKLLAVKQQHNHVVVWFLVDTAQPTIARSFCLQATGEDASAVSEATYVDTVLLDAGHLVMHVFEVPT